MGASSSSTSGLWRPVIRGAFDQVLTSAESAQKEVLEHLNAPADERPDEEKLVVEARLKQEEWIQQNNALIEPIWDKYDANGDNELDKHECRLLTTDFIKEQLELMPTIIEESLDLVLRPLKIALERKGLAGHYLRTRTKAVEAAKAVAAEHLNAMLADVDKVSDELWEKMDVNHDGKVDKEEFMGFYLRSATEAHKDLVDVDSVVSGAIEGAGMKMKR